MDDWQKEHLSANLVQLSQCTRLNAYVLTTFLTAEVLEIEDILILEEENDPIQRNLMCFEIIKEKQIPNVYGKLVAVLEGTNHKDAASILKLKNKRKSRGSVEITKL